jgi:hypothetical protein
MGRHWYLPGNWKSFIGWSLEQWVSQCYAIECYRIFYCALFYVFVTRVSLSNQPACWTPDIYMYGILFLLYFFAFTRKNYTTQFQPPLWAFPSLTLSSHISFPVNFVSYISFRNASFIRYSELLLPFVFFFMLLSLMIVFPDRFLHPDFSIYLFYCNQFTNLKNCISPHCILVQSGYTLLFWHVLFSYEVDKNLPWHRHMFLSFRRSNFIITTVWQMSQRSAHEQPLLMLKRTVQLTCPSGRKV